MARPLVVLAVLCLSALASPAGARTTDIHEGTTGEGLIDYSFRASMFKIVSPTPPALPPR
jgi:hypothetical protein